MKKATKKLLRETLAKNKCAHFFSPKPFAANTGLTMTSSQAGMRKFLTKNRSA
jgi:hypothetical protein